MKGVLFMTKVDKYIKNGEIKIEDKKGLCCYG